MNNSASASRRTWNRVMNALVWASAVLVIVLVAGILGMVLVRGIPHISWKFLTTTASVLKGTDGILPAILNTLYVILLTLLIVLPLGVGAAVYLTEYARNRKVISVIEFTNETLALFCLPVRAHSVPFCWRSAPAVTWPPALDDGGACSAVQH